MRKPTFHKHQKKQEIIALTRKQINIFKLSVLRIAAFLEYLQQVLKLVRAYAFTEGVAESKLPAIVQPYFTAFAKGVAAVDQAFKQSRASDLTKKIADEDTRRDNLYRAFESQLKMYLKFDFDREMQEAAELVWNIVRKYQVDVAANYSEESGKLQQMIQELGTNYQAELRLKKLGLTSLVEQLKTANEAMRTMMAQRNDERTYQEKAALANARKEADEAYKNLVAMLNAAALMDDDETRYDDLFKQVNELIAYYRQYVVPKGSKAVSTATDEDSGSTDGEGGEPSGSDNGTDSGDTSTTTPPTSDTEQVTNGGAPIDDDNDD